MYLKASKDVEISTFGGKWGMRLWIKKWTFKLNFYAIMYEKCMLHNEHPFRNFFFQFQVPSNSSQGF